MHSQQLSAASLPLSNRRLLQPRRRYVSENLDTVSKKEDFTPPNSLKPWVSVTRLFSSAHKRLRRSSTSSSSSIRQSSTITGGPKPAAMLKTLTTTRHKQHATDNTSLQEFMKDVLHVMKHGTYAPGKDYATIVKELRDVLAVAGGPERARAAWYGHLLPRFAALLTQPIQGISTLTDRVAATLSLWYNLQGCLAPLLQALWQPLPGMRAERDVVTVFRCHVLPLVSLRGADEVQKNEVLVHHRQRLLDMLLVCARYSWCSGDCCKQHNRMKDVNIHDQLLNMNNFRSESLSNSSDSEATKNESSSQNRTHKHKTVYRKTSAPSGSLHFRTELIENIDENDELVLQNHRKEQKLCQESNELEKGLYEEDTWRKTSCPAHLATLGALDSSGGPPTETFGDGTTAEQSDTFNGTRHHDGFGGRETLRLQSRRYKNTATRDYNLSEELSLLFGQDPACGTAFILDNMAALLDLHHDRE